MSSISLVRQQSNNAIPLTCNQFNSWEVITLMAVWNSLFTVLQWWIRCIWKCVNQMIHTNKCAHVNAWLKRHIRYAAKINLWKPDFQVQIIALLVVFSSNRNQELISKWIYCLLSWNRILTHFWEKSIKATLQVLGFIWLKFGIKIMTASWFAGHWASDFGFKL